jgi:NAD+ synthase (glutamine-hydrolysing)
MQALGVTGAEIDIRPAAEQMLKDIGHAFADGQPVHDITFENVQAGLRTDYLFRLANQNHGFVLGTGDLSELALGWCTYGVGDHMSHYNVNGGVAKTLIPHLIRWVAEGGLVGEAATPTLHAILATEISPELVPAGADGAIQSTQSIVGPYALNDFFLFYISRFGLKPSKVAYLAHQAWGDATTGSWPVGLPEAEWVAYDLATTLKGVLEAPAAAIVSSLPLLNRPDCDRLTLLSDAFDLLGPNGVLVQFTYGVTSPIPRRKPDFLKMV